MSALARPGEGDSRLRVLVFSRWYLPGFRGGGPVRSLVNLVRALGTEIDFRIVTLDRDHTGGPPYPSVRSGSWQAVEGTEVLYLSQARVSMRRLVREVGTVTPHVIYLYGFFDRVFTQRILLARRAGHLSGIPILLAPQGEFSAGALQLKPLKKAAYIKLARASGLVRDLTWQASTEMERQDILRTMKLERPGDVRVAADLTDDVAYVPGSRQAAPGDGVLRMCFLSRISPKKNLDFALRVLADVKVRVEFTIYGPVEDQVYWARCKAMIDGLPANIRATYGGEVHPVDVRRTLAGHDLFFLPTLGENFGHVIHEALSVGVPVLVSDQTPWRDLEQHGVGWSLPLDAVSEFAQAIETASRTLPHDRDAIAGRAVAFAVERADRPATIRRMHDLFKGLARR